MFSVRYFNCFFNESIDADLYDFFAKIQDKIFLSRPLHSIGLYGIIACSVKTHARRVPYCSLILRGEAADEARGGKNRRD